MNQRELDAYFREILRMDEIPQDASQNGLQVENGGGEIGKIAFAVDACLDTIEAASALGAKMLFVHHGIFWRDSPLLAGAHFRRAKALFDGGVALYACHLPLDVHENLGNNALIAKKIGAEKSGVFGSFKGVSVGLLARLGEPAAFEDLQKTLCPNAEPPLGTLRFGAEKIRSVAICSGGAGGLLDDAIAAQADLFLTGELDHVMFHKAKEAGISVLALGHYASETFGVKAVMQKVREDLSLDAAFIDSPTGL